MTTEELAECLGVARQTVNRWIREQHWKTEKFPGVKGGRARLIHIDASVREFILNIPAFRKLPAFYQAEEAFAEYCNAANNFGLIHNQFRIAILAILDPELSAFFAKH